MSEIRVSDMIEAESVNDNDVIMIVQDGVNKKAKAKKIKKDFIEVAGIDEYDNTSTYAEGDYCIYNNKMYKCTTEISTAEDWTVAHWTETSIVEEIDNGGGGSHVLGDTLPIGIIMEYPGSNIPSGWLLCDGQAVSRTLYSELFSLLGTTYGSGDGSTTFNIPNLKGKVAVGKDENDTDFDTLGETGGEKTHTLTENEMPTHTHSIGKPVSTNSGSKSWLLLDVNKGEYSEQRTQPSGGGQAHNNLQPYIVQNFLIKAKQAPGTATLAEVLPVGSEIDFGGSVNDIPIGWEEVAGNEVVLYNDTTGTGVTGLNSINLSDSISNYQRIKIVIDTSRDGSTKYAYNIIKEFNIDSRLTQFSESVCYDKILWFTFSISNNTLTITKNRVTEMSGTMSEGNYIYITKIIGYKE